MDVSRRWSEKTLLMYSSLSMTTGPRFLSVRSVIVSAFLLSLERVSVCVRVRLVVL